MFYTSSVFVVGILSNVNSFLASLLIKLVLPTLQSPTIMTLEYDSSLAESCLKGVKMSEWSYPKMKLVVSVKVVEVLSLALLYCWNNFSFSEEFES